MSATPRNVDEGVIDLFGLNQAEALLQSPPTATTSGAAAPRCGVKASSHALLCSQARFGARARALLAAELYQVHHRIPSDRHFVGIDEGRGAPQRSHPWL